VRPARRKRVVAGLVALASVGLARQASAIDLPNVGGSPLKLDVTETSIVSQRFRERDGENFDDQGYFAWLNRLNLVLGWKKFTLGARIDTAVYGLRPQERNEDPRRLQALFQDGSSRYRNSIYPAKLWFSIKDNGVDVTVGDSYVQFGRGLTLALRKVDELGIDTTLFGGKISINRDPFGVTLVAGVANPARVDEPTGRALFSSAAVPGLPNVDPDSGAWTGGYNAPVPPQPIFGSDRIVGAEITSGRGLPAILSTHVVRVTKCAPYRYDANGNIDDNYFDKPIGTCEESDRVQWFQTISNATNPTADARETTNLGQSFEIPSLWGHGSLYVEGATQHREKTRVRAKDTDGNAIYGSLVFTGGPIANTLEVKSYRNYWALAGGVNTTLAAAFNNVTYSIPPTAEPIITDTYGNMNVCMNSARDRLDYRLTPTFLAYGAYAYSVSLTEQPGGACDKLGKSTGQKAIDNKDFIHDGTLGVETRWNQDRSYLFANVNARHDMLDNGKPYYRELAIQYTYNQYLGGPFSVEITGRHRYRVQDGENIHGANYKGEPWWQGEHYNALKIAPKWVLSQGFEYTTLIGFPTYYLNGGILYKFTSQSNLRLYAGQNRGGLRCISGICRVFPSFDGARAELTLRF
jgi:hypothetical protein